MIAGPMSGRMKSIEGYQNHTPMVRLETMEAAVAQTMPKIRPITAPRKLWSFL